MIHLLLAKYTIDWQLTNVDELYVGIIKEMKDAGLKINVVSDKEYEKIKKVTVDEVWGKYIDGKTVTQEKVDLILNEMVKSEETGNWGYSID